MTTATLNAVILGGDRYVFSLRWEDGVLRGTPSPSTPRRS
jgi:hypothetical protein